MSANYLVLFIILWLADIEEAKPDVPVAPDTCYRRMDCYCGKQRVPTRIVNGQEAVPHAYPWMASLMFLDNLAFCGGALINDRYVLTAAHCMNPANLENIRVLLGHHDLKKLKDAKLYHIDKIITNSKYSDNDPHQKYDIAMVRLREPVVFDKTIHPICLPGRFFPYSNYSKLIVSGFGRLKEDGITSDRLLEVEVPEVSNEECERLLHKIRVTPDHICAGNGTLDSCQGDSGGPLMTTIGNRWYLAGITSWGVACAHNKYPGVFTRPWSYAQWISENTMDAKYCNNRAEYDSKTYEPCPFRLP